MLRVHIPHPTMPPRTDAAHPTAEPQLLRAVGVLGLAASIVNVTIGGGIFRLPATVAGSLGRAAPLAYLVTVVAMLFVVLVFADAGSRVARTGGPYAYVEVAFGRFAGFLAGVLLWTAGTLALSAVATIFASSLVALVPGLESRFAGAAIVLSVFAFGCAINIRGVRQGTRLNVVATVAKLLPLLLLAVVGVFAARAANLTLDAPPRVGELTRGAMVLVFAFAGIESALTPSGEVRDPARTVPAAVFLAMLLVAVLYVTLQTVAQGILGDELARSATPLADAAGVALGPWGRRLLLAGAAVSMFGYVSGMTLAIPRALFALARDGVLPGALAAVHSVYRTPYVAILVQGAVSALLALTNGFETLAVLSNVAVLLLYGACACAAWVLRRRGVHAAAEVQRDALRIARLAPPVALAVILWLLTSVSRAEWVAVASLLVASCLVYLLRRPAPASADAAMLD